MALYHFTAKAVSRGKGQSAVHTAAYNAREQLHDERENRDTKDYGYKGKTEFSGIFAPKDAPEWTHDREQLWNRAEDAEKRVDSQTARNVEFALPHELNAEQRRRLVTDFCRETFARRGMVADVNIHAPHDNNDPRNGHVHCLLTMRRLDGDGFAKTKEREWNSKAELEQWREKWAQMGARALERAGHEQEADRFRHGHKTLAGQQEAALARGDQEWAEHCDKEAQIHKGAAVSAMEQRDDPRLADNEIAREASAIDDRNAARAEIRDSEKELAAAQQAAEKQREAERQKPEQGGASSTGKVRDDWHSRAATEMEEKIFRIQDAVERIGDDSLAIELHAQGILLVRVDRGGKGDLEREHGKPIEAEIGEVVALTQSGEVHRLNPRFIDIDKLERAASGPLNFTATLSEGRAHFIEVEQDRKHFADKAAEQQARVERQAQKQQQSERWQNRDATKTEEKILDMQDAAERGGQKLGAALWKEGLTLARVDAAGIAAKDEQYRREFEKERAEGNSDARQRHTNVKEGELVCVNRWGNIYRLNPKILELDKLEHLATGGTAPSLSATLDHMIELRAQERANYWQRRDMTDMEKTISALHDRAAFQDGKGLRGMLYEEGILLARVDAAGIAIKNTEYQREFENDKLQDIWRGTNDARLRSSQVQEGEMVAVTRSGSVFRLNPRFLDTDSLEKAIRSSGHDTAKLSESLQHFADVWRQGREDHQGRHHTGYETRENIHQQRGFAHDVKQGMKDALGIDGKDEGMKVVNTKGLVTSLGSFVESLLGMGAKREPASPQQQQQRALEALEHIEESLERGDRLTASDVANLLPEQLVNLHRHGDAYMREMIDDLKRHREQEQDYGRERERER